MVGTSTYDAGWAAEILGFGNHDMPDIGRGLQAAAAPDSRVNAEYSARLATMFEHGQIKEGDTHIARSIIDSEFQVSVIGTITVAGHPAILPRVSG